MDMRDDRKTSSKSSVGALSSVAACTVHRAAVIRQMTCPGLPAHRNMEYIPGTAPLTPCWLQLSRTTQQSRPIYAPVYTFRVCAVIHTVWFVCRQNAQFVLFSPSRVVSHRIRTYLCE